MYTVTLPDPAGLALPRQTGEEWDLTCLRCQETTVSHRRNLSLALAEHARHRCAA